MKEGKRRKSLYGKLLGMTVLPLFALAFVITLFSAHSLVETINKEVKKGLMDLSTTILTFYDYSYPGDYSAVMQNGALYLLKGEQQLNGNFTMIDAVKEQTGVDVTVFYQDIRVITTLFDD